MGALVDIFKSLKLWQIGVLVTVLAGAAGATYGVYALVSGPSSTGLSENQQLIPVQYGNLVNQVSTNGSLIFRNRETLTFGTQGTAGEVLVEEGQQVEEGQELVKLDQITVASLQQAVAQEKINLKSAEDALAKANNPHTPLDMAQAEANVASARLSLQNGQDDLAALLEPTAQDIAQAEANVANAKLSLQDAQNALDRLLTPTSGDIAQSETTLANAKLSLQGVQDDLARAVQATAQDIAQAEATVTNSKISVQKAREALDAFKSGPTDADIARTQSQVDFAGTALANATRDLSLARKEWNAKVETAQDTFSVALESYQNVFQKWFGIDPAGIEGDPALGSRQALDPDRLLDFWGADLDSLFDPESRFQDSSLGFLAQGPPPDDPATPWNEFVVYVWMNLTPGHLVGTCENIVITPGTQCVKSEMDDGWDALESATDNLDTVETQAAKAIANAEDAVTRAEESLANTEETLADLKAGSDPLEIEAKEKELVLAETKLDEAEARLAELTNGFDAVEVEAKEKQVALAKANLDQAEDDLSKLNDEPDALEVETKRKQVALGQANLDQAEDDLSKLNDEPDALEVETKRKQVALGQANLDQAEDDLSKLNDEPDALEVETKRKQVALGQANLDEGQEELVELKGSVDPLEVALREADIAAARLALDTLLQQLEGATLKAPMAGIVSLVNVEAGQAVNPNTPVIEIVDPTVVEVDGIVDEIDVLFVREGAQAQVTMDALPGQVLEGTVSTIASAARSQQGVVSYPIRIQVQLPEGVRLVEGLSATARIVIREDTNVLLIPNQALYGTFEQPLVRVMNNGTLEERPVDLGNSDDFWVVVLQGLQEGDQVAMETTEAATDPFAQIRQRIQGGGGFGGSGFPGGGGRRPGN